MEDSSNESLVVQDEEQVNDVEEVNSTLTAENDNRQPKLKIKKIRTKKFRDSKTSKIQITQVFEKNKYI